MRALRKRLAIVTLAVLVGCSDAPSERQIKPTFGWGYPEYSRYDASGNHVGTTLYQQDPRCRERLTFYSCDFVDAKTPDTPANNPRLREYEYISALSCTSVFA